MREARLSVPLEMVYSLVPRASVSMKTVCMDPYRSSLCNHLHASEVVMVNVGRHMFPSWSVSPTHLKELTW